MLAHRLGIVDRVEKYNTKNCFITIKVISRLILNVGLLTRPRHR